MDTREKLNGTWHNQHGSEMDISVGPDGKLTGKFRSATGLPKTGDECELNGFSADGLVAFTVDFGRFDSLTSWTGHHAVENDEEVIRAAWHMAVTLPNGKSDQLWKGIWTGEDVFRRGAAAASATKRPARLPSSPLPALP